VIMYLKDICISQTLKNIANHIGNSSKSVRCQANRQGLKVVPKYHSKLKLQEYAFYIGEEVRCFGTIYEIAEILNTSWKNIGNYRFKSYYENDSLKRRLVEI